MKRRKLLNKIDVTKEKEKDKDQQVTCYGYKKPGHYRHKCPQLKKATKNNRKKAIVFFWGGSDISSSDSKEKNEEVANLYFMTQDDEVTLEFLNDSYDELHNAFADLLFEYKKIKI